MKLFTEKQVSVAAFLGSPVAGGLLMAHNANATGQKNKERYLYISIATTALLFAVAAVLPERKSGNYILPLCAAFAMGYWYRRTQGDLNVRFPESSRASWWWTIGIALMFAIIVIAAVFLSVLIITAFEK